MALAPDLDNLVTNWRAGVAILEKCRLGYENGDKRHREHLVRLAADPNAVLTHIERCRLERLLHRYRQQVRQQGAIASNLAPVGGCLPVTHENAPESEIRPNSL